MERFKIEQMSLIPNLYIVADDKAGVYCMFEKGKFNDTQEFVCNSKDYTAQELAEICKDMGDWLRLNHYDKLF